MTLVPVFKVGLGTLLFVGCFAILAAAFFIVALDVLLTFLLMYALLSLVANAIEGRDPEPSAPFMQRLADSQETN